MADANIKAVITADDRASKTLNNFGNNVSKVGVKAKIAIAAVGVAAIKFGVDSVKAYEESENALTQLNAVLKSTNGIAGVTSSAAIKLAASFQKVTKFSDEEVLGAENLLLTFTKIGKDIFPQATETVLNMATALGEDTKSASIQLGKALQDPILGITALRRVGVNFNDAQKEVVKKLVETGQSAKAQALILKELQTEFGGSARAAGETFAGKLAILKNRFNDVQESVGKLIINGLFRLMSIIQQAIPIVLGFVKTIVDFFRPSIIALYNTFSKQLLPALQKLWQTLEPGLTATLKVLAKILGATVVVALFAFINALNVTIKILRIGINIISLVARGFASLGGAAYNAGSVIVGAFRSAFNAIAYLWNNTVGRLSFHLPSWVPLIGGKGFDVPKIPQLAEGGIVTKPTLAMIGEAGPEAVVPLNKSSQSVAPTINVSFSGIFTGSEMEFRKLAIKVFQAGADVAGMQNNDITSMTTQHWRRV